MQLKLAMTSSEATPKDSHNRSPNVSRVMLFNLIDGIAFSVWNATVFQLFIYQIAGSSNAAVGWASGAGGAAQVAAAAVGSYFADKRDRRRAARVAGVCGILTVVGSIVATYYEHLWMIFAAAVGWGYYMGFSQPTTEALFADSIPLANEQACTP